VYTLFHGGKCSGRSRHGAPVRSTHSIAFTIRRLSVAGRALRPRSDGKPAAIVRQTSSLSSNRLPIPTMEHILSLMERRFASVISTSEGGSIAHAHAHEDEHEHEHEHEDGR
jgi:hypothetical protein